MGRHHTPIDMVAEDLIHEDEVSEAELSDDGEDDPKYPGSSTETLVRPIPTTPWLRLMTLTCIQSGEHKVRERSQ